MKSKKEEFEQEQAEHDGTRPDEMVGPDESEGSIVRCEARVTADHGVEVSEFEAADEIHESFPIEPIPTVMDADGMPQMVLPDTQQTQAVAFTYDTVICVEDDREYFEVFSDDLRNLPPGLVYLDHPSKCHLLSFRERYEPATGAERERETYKPDEVLSLWGKTVTKIGQDEWRLVRPVRPRCQFYRRQVFSNDDQPDPDLPGHQLVFRVCEARRSNGGAHMSLRDEGIYMCDFRSPPDPKTSKVQDSKDKEKLVNRPDLLRIPLFDMPGDDIQIDKGKS